MLNATCAFHIKSFHPAKALKQLLTHLLHQTFVSPSSLHQLTDVTLHEAAVHEVATGKSPTFKTRECHLEGCMITEFEDPNIQIV